MWLKLILFGIVAVVIYRAFGGKVPLVDRPQSAQDASEGDTLVPCDTCGTYVTLDESIVVAKKHYCSKECLPA